MDNEENLKPLLFKEILKVLFSSVLKKHTPTAKFIFVEKKIEKEMELFKKIFDLNEVSFKPMQNFYAEEVLATISAEEFLQHKERFIYSKLFI